MRSLFILLLLMTGGIIILPAQRHENRNFTLQKGTNVLLKLQYADTIYVQGVSGNQLSFSMSIVCDQPEFYEAHELKYQHKKSELKISSSISEDFKRRQNKEKNFNFSSKRIIYTIQIPQWVELKVTTISGNVQIRDMRNKINAKSISGFVDCDWEEVPSNISLSSVTGEVYTDINVDISTPIKDMPIVGYPLQGTIKSGGIPLRLETISSNIYLRRRK